MRRDRRGLHRFGAGRRPAPSNGIERILVNCAGIAPGKRTVAKKRETGELIPHDVASFRRAVEINLIGTYAMISKCATAMAALDPVTPDGGRGVIVNTSSVAAQDGQIGQAAYAASKGGVLGLTLPVARDLSGFGIRVMTIMPGLFHTPLFEGIAEDYRKALEANVPFPSRFGRPEEYADAGEGDHRERHAQRRRHPPRRRPAHAAEVKPPGPI